MDCLILLIASCGVLLLRSPISAAAETLAEDVDAPAPAWFLRARWIFLAAVPSGLLIAVTRAYFHPMSPPRRCCGCCRCHSIS